MPTEYPDSDINSRSKWISKVSPFSIFRIIPEMVTSVGDGMRELDKKAILKNEFVVVYGDVVSNMTLDSVLAEHRKRRAADKNCIMTMVLREPGSTEDDRRRGVPVFALDARSGRCLHYEAMGFGAPDRFVGIAEDVLKEAKGAAIDLRADLQDCGIDVCTPDVLALWSDNFDFHAPRRNFLHSVLKDYELNGKKFHAHVLPASAAGRPAYAHRVRSLADYAAVSRQIVARWAYPVGPDGNLARRDGADGPTDYRLSRGLVYQESGVLLARSGVVGPRTVLGRGASVGHEARVSDSVVGRHARIGAGAVIENAFVWDHAIIGAGAVVRNAIVGSAATLGANVVLQPGALVGDGVVVADGTTVKGTSKLTRWRRRRLGTSSTEPLERVAPDPAIVGVGGDGAECEPDSDDGGNGDDEDDAAREAVALYHGLAAALHPPPHRWDDTFSPLTSAPSTPPRSPSVASGASRRMSFASMTGDDSSGGFLSLAGAGANSSARRAAAADYHAEAVRLLLDALPAGVAPENVQIDFNSLRLAHDAKPPMQRRALAVALARHVLALMDGADLAEGSHHRRVLSSGGVGVGRHSRAPSSVLGGAPVATPPAPAATLGAGAAAAKVVPLYVFLLRRSVASSTAKSSGPEAAAAAEEQSELLAFLQGELARQGRPSAAPEKKADLAVDGSEPAAAPPPAAANGRAAMPFVARELVRLDVVDAEGLERWWDDPRSRASEELTAVRETCAELVKFLCEDDDESEEDEDASSEDE
jgi:NDP-sugar pyrophosphorylase family protein